MGTGSSAFFSGTSPDLAALVAPVGPAEDSDPHDGSPVAPRWVENGFAFLLTTLVCLRIICGLLVAFLSSCVVYGGQQPGTLTSRIDLALVGTSVGLSFGCSENFG